MIRRLLLATVLALASVTAVTTGPAQARACKIDHTCVTVYYSDSTRTVVVGEKYEDCNGAVDMWGVRSGYLEFYESPC
ncbi:DUF6289 family protein [Nonomuraea gerenzanensis]|uniref:Secreted protein n=1 Tax=Nonomuraea gerenzanensis TaxID=93944 RepID=A0A1M4EDM5_9ACTN|nr:DUF6289 family protein [Nonomuraea gerenzanensis]UBU08533.1 hypothetical protein LCN96_29525 [Nonomuraea gerenzanensis]SBO96882.1 hypothetical protein BN4615_P6398 [Nonomuraea gerenzanensis]